MAIPSSPAGGSSVSTGGAVSVHEAFLVEAAGECGIRMSLSDARKMLEALRGSPTAARHRATVRARRVPALTLAEGRQLVAELRRHQVQVALTGAEVVLIGLVMVGMALLFGPAITGSTMWKQKIKPAIDKAVEEGKQILEPVG